MRTVGHGANAAYLDVTVYTMLGKDILKMGVCSKK